MNWFSNTTVFGWIGRPTGVFSFSEPKYGSKRKIMYFFLRSFPAVFIKVKRDFYEIACTAKGPSRLDENLSYFLSSLFSSFRSTFLSCLNVARHLMASIIITLLCYLCMKNAFASTLTHFSSMEIAVEETS